jgi:hypothetical protein
MDNVQNCDSYINIPSLQTYIYIIVLEINYTQADTKQHPFLSCGIIDFMDTSKSRQRLLYVKRSKFCERNGLSGIMSALRKIPRGRNEDLMKVRRPWYGVKYYLTIFNSCCETHRRYKRQLSLRCKHGHISSGRYCRPEPGS